MRQRRWPWTLILIILAILLGLLGVAVDYLVRVGATKPPPFVQQHLELLLVGAVPLAIILIALLGLAAERIRERLRPPSETRATFVQLVVGTASSLAVIASVAAIIVAVVLIATRPIIVGQQSATGGGDTQAILQFFRDNGPGISAFVAVVSAPAIFIALVIAVVQAREIRQQLQLASMQLRLASITSSTLHFRELNELVLVHPEVAAIFEGSKTERAGWAADIVFGTFEARYLLREEGLIDPVMWQSDMRTMEDAFRKYAFLKAAWEGEEGGEGRKHKQEYYEPFRNFIDATILGNLTTQPPASASLPVSPTPEQGGADGPEPGG